MSGFGAYGKMPALGDFFRISPPEGFVAAWDPWLQTRLLDLQADMGEHWKSAYLGAPIWRFSLSAALAGELPVFGVLMPSVDRVGRTFPLTLVAVGPPEMGARSLYAAVEEHFAELEDLALSTLSEGVGLEHLTDALDQLKAPEFPQPNVVSKDDEHVSFQSQGSVVPALLSVAREPWSTTSVWSAVVGSYARTIICEGLPGAAHSQALFDLAAPTWNDAAERTEVRA